jgi:hypothetical protein
VTFAPPLRTRQAGQRSMLAVHGVDSTYLPSIKVPSYSFGAMGAPKHIRKCFWLRWHERRGRLRRLRLLGIKGRSLGVAGTSGGAWAVSKTLL